MPNYNDWQRYQRFGVCLTSSQVWVAWTQTTADTSTVQQVWPQWMTQDVTGTSDSQFAQSVWWAWQGTTTEMQSPLPQGFGVVGAGAYLRQPQRPALSPRDASIVETRRRAYAMRERVAERKAEALLLENLDERQRAEWLKEGWFHVDTPTRRFKIRRGRAGNVELVKGHEPRRHASSRRPRYCCHIISSLPNPDNVLAQMLMLKYDEDTFLAMANVS